MFKKFLPVFIIFFLSFFAVRPLFNPGFFSMHDFQQVARLYELNKSLLAGAFPVRWVADLGFSYGYNLFNFYPPFVYYLGEIIHLFFQASFIDSTKIVWAIALIGSALAMYKLSREFFGRIGGVVSAIFYLYIPYHAVDAYVRGALAELFSFVWLPLILLYSYKKKAVPTGIFLALLMITHNLIFLPFVGFFVIWSFFTNRSLSFLAKSLLICFSLSAFFWLPSLAEKQFTLVDKFLTTGLASYQIHFVCPDQLWNSQWGYGGSVAGCLDGLSFKIGKPQILLSFLAIPIAIYLWFKKSRKISSVLFLVSCLLVISVFMTLDWSRFVWDHITLLWYLQFPWRFLEFVALFSSLLAGALSLVIKKNHWQILIAVGLIISVIYLHGKYFEPSTYLPNATDQLLTSDQEIKWVVSQTSFEYMAKGTAVLPTPQGSYILDVATFPQEKYLVIIGDFLATESTFLPNKFSLSGTSKNGATVQFQINNFPGWAVWVDGKQVSINDANKLKLITITVPAGQHTITGRFTDTPVRTFGNLLSLSAIIVLVVVFFYARRRNQT